jgi:hypothetical protein
LLGAIGLVAADRSGQATAWLLLLVIACLNLVCAPSVTVVRYTLPATPALLLLAARGASAVQVFLGVWLRTRHGGIAQDVAVDACTDAGQGRNGGGLYRSSGHRSLPLPD